MVSKNENRVAADVGLGVRPVEDTGGILTTVPGIECIQDAELV